MVASGSSSASSAGIGGGCRFSLGWVIGTTEALWWSALVRLLLATRTTEQVLGVLDAFPRRRRRAPIPPPSERRFRLAGACLGRSLARSQYLRTRGRPHTLLIGVRGGLGDFAAHAWLAGDLVDADFVVLRVVPR